MAFLYQTASDLMTIRCNNLRKEETTDDNDEEEEDEDESEDVADIKEK
jgi:hypothetical protein